MDTTKLKGIIPDSVIAQIPTIPQLTTNLRLAHFLSQCCHESGNFRLTHENLNYRADQLLKVFPHYFNAANVAAYEHNPEKIANRVYANRMGNGDEASGDGWKYCGEGYIQEVHTIEIPANLIIE